MHEGRKVVRCPGCMELYEAFDSICPHCGYIYGTPPKEQYHLIPETILRGKYILGKVLGYGGFGITYIAWDELLQRKVAIKEYMPRECAARMAGTKRLTVFSGDKTKQFRTGMESFKEEAGKLLKVHDLEGTVKVFDLFEENGTAYLVMEYLDGKNLDQVLKEKGKMTVEETLELIHPIIVSLEEIHKMNLIHRDISPDNLFLTKSQEVKLLDFGSARYSVLAQNKSMSVIIKHGYAPPEQYQVSRDQGAWTDVYSLAATFYRMITGEVPEDAVDRMVKDTLAAPSELGIIINKNQENALMNALNTKVSSRTQNMEEFEKQLFSKGEVPRISNEDGKPIKEKKSRVPLIITSIFILGIITGMVIFIKKSSVKEPDPIAVEKEEQSVANYIGADYDTASKEAKEAGLTLIIRDTVNGDTKEGTIVEQNPEVGKEVVNNTISVVVSAGQQKIKMPSYVGYSEKESTDIAQDSGMLLSISEKEESNIIPGFVVRQNKKAGKEVPKGSAVSLVFSAGRKNLDSSKKIKMELLEGKTFKEALKLAEDKGFYLGIDKHAYSIKAPKGTICEQSEKKDAKITQGTEIKVVISDGPEQMKVPKVVGVSLQEAKTALEKQKLKVRVVFEYSSEYNEEMVMEQSIEANTFIDEGSEVTLTISKGARPDKTPKKKSGSSSSKKRSSSGASKKKKTRSKSAPKSSLDGWNIVN